MITGFLLQLVAMATMLIDHIGEYFMADYLPFRCIGRFAFIIYAFLMAEGFRHYKDDPERVSSHLRFLVMLTVISEVCYDFLDVRVLAPANLISSQSVMITLLLAFLGLLAMERWKRWPVNVAFALILTSLLTYIIKSNYKLMGVFLVYMFYVYLRYSEGKPYTRRIAELMVIMLLYLCVYHWGVNDFCSLQVYITRMTPFFRWFYGIQLLSPFLLAAYNGNEGYRSRTFKTVYRWFYPAHLLILGVIYRLR